MQDIFTKSSSFHTKEKNEITKSTVFEPKLCNFIVKREDPVTNTFVKIASIDKYNMSPFTFSENHDDRV